MPNGRYLVVVLAAAGLSCSAGKDGPTPKPQSIMPAQVCLAQRAVTVRIAGSDFSPAVGDSLTSEPRVLMPAVALESAGVPSVVPEAGVRLPAGAPFDGMALELDLPMGFVAPRAAADPPVVYDVVVTNPNGNLGRLPAALTVQPPPTLTAIMPATGVMGATVPVNLVGTGFLTGMTVRLESVPAVSTTANVGSATAATANLNLAGVAAGTYGVTVETIDGCAFTLPNAFTVIVPKVILVSSVDPPFGCTCERTPVTIKGADFVSTPIASMRPAGMPQAAETRWERTAFIDSTSLTSVVPAGAPVGSYDVTVENPVSDGGRGVLMNGFRVVSMPVPRIFNVEPSRGTTQSDTPVTVIGANFRNQARLELLSTTGTPVFTSAAITVAPSPGGSFTTTIPTTTLAEGVYLVRVTNLDEMTYTTFSFFVVKNPSSKLSAFAAGSALMQARREHAAVLALDDLGNKYLYVAGGADSAGAAIDTVEVSALSKFGDLGAWTRLPIATHTLLENRRGLGLVAVPVFKPSPMGADVYIPEKTYVYALGGRDSAASMTVERAVVLRNSDAPVVTATAAPGAGALGAGTWYYKVAAVAPAGDPDNPGGETLTSDELVVTTSGSVVLGWPVVMINGAPAAAYRIYRSDAPNGTSQSEHRIAEVTTNAYTDVGAAMGTERFLPPGSLGVWKTIAAPLAAARFGVAGLLGADPTGARFLYAVGGRSATTGGFLRSVEVIAVDSAGQLGAAWGPAEIDGTANPAPMLDSRAYGGADIENRSNVSTFAALPSTRLWVAGGVGQTGGTGTIGGLRTLEFANVAAGGKLTAWANPAGLDLNGDMAGAFFAITSDQLFAVGGARMASDTGFSNITSGPGRQIVFGAGGDLMGPTSSSSNGPPTALALGATVRTTGLLYIIAGTSSGTDAVATTYRALN